MPVAMWGGGVGDVVTAVCSVAHKDSSSLGVLAGWA